MAKNIWHFFDFLCGDVVGFFMKCLLITLNSEESSSY